MKLDECGSQLIIVRDLAAPVAQVASALERERLTGVLECVAAYDTVGIHHDGVSFDREAAEAALQILEKKSVSSSATRTWRVPVCYPLGPDFEAICSTLGMNTDQVVKEHSALKYEVSAIGFCPGFPYLKGLNTTLAGLPRLQEPRVRVPKGSVGITGEQCGIYPDSVPGGWNLICITPCVIAEPLEGYFALRTGDIITFDPISEDRFERLLGSKLDTVQ